MTLEDDLRDSLKAHADRFEPTEQSYVAIERRLVAGSVSGRAANGRSLGPRLLIAAASLAVLGAAGIFAFQNSGGQQVTVGTGAGPGPTTGLGAEQTVPLPTTTAPERDNGEAAQPSVPDETDTGEGSESATGSNSTLPAPPDFIYGPRRASEVEAARSFLELIQLPGDEALLEVDGSVVRVTTEAENGQIVPITELELRTEKLSDGSPGFVVVGANTPGISITSPVPGLRIQDSTIPVAGKGRGFEGGLAVELFSGNDGVKLSMQYAKGGSFATPEPFEATLTVSGEEWAWVVVTSDIGSDSTLAPMSAVAVQVSAPLYEDTYTVTAIPVDDPDGLWVRNRPDAGVGQKLESLPAGFTGLRLRSRVLSVGDQGSPETTTWLNVWLPEPIEGSRAGWVNAAFLAREGEVAEADLTVLAESFIAAVNGDGTTMVALPWSTRRPVHVGWASGLDRYLTAELTHSTFWTLVRTVAVPEARFENGQMDSTYLDLLHVAEPAAAALEFGTDPTQVSPYGLDQSVLQKMFAGTTFVTLGIGDSAAAESEWQTTTLFVEPGPDGPEIVGVVATLWVP